MKLRAIVLSALFALGAMAAPPIPTNAALAVADYDLAEFVFRQHMSSDTSHVFHLAVGTNDVAPPPDFITRFQGQSPIVRSAHGNVLVVSNKFVLDRITRKEAVGLGIRQLRVLGDAAEVQVVRFASFTSSSTRYYLVRERGRWRVKDKKTEWTACG
jgi:hypothetical protein